MKLFLKGRFHQIGNVWSYVFQPELPLHWNAGQAVRIDLPHPNPDAEGTDRYFTVSSAPHEGNITITTRQTASTFKQALHRLRPGESVKLVEEPSGTFVWRRSPHPLVFVAQGIGITPFRSMIADRLHHGQPANVKLFFTNFSEDIPYKHEVDEWARTHPDISVTYLSEPATVELLRRNVPDLKQSQVFVSGPTSLIGLLSPPVNLPVKQLNQDTFPNYPSASY